MVCIHNYHNSLLNTRIGNRNGNSAGASNERWDRRYYNSLRGVSLVLFLCLFLILYGYQYQKQMLLDYPFVKSTPENDVVVEEEVEELCQKKYLLLTTQRSGSTWTCNLLHQQKGISCGGRKSELLIQYSYKTMNGTIADVTWQEYQRHLDKAFAEVCQYNPETSIGFKLMYNQIPPQFLEDRKLENYLKANGVSLIHLVREAKILVLASQLNVGERNEIFGENIHHTSNATLANQIRHSTKKMMWNDNRINRMLEMETLSTKWQARVHSMAPLVQYYYVSYESLLAEDEREYWIRQLIGFLTKKSHDSRNSNNNNNNKTKIGRVNLLQLSEPRCSDRIANYEEFRAHKKVKYSRTAAACDMIDRSE